MRIEQDGDYEITIYSNSSGLFEFQNLGITIYQKSYWNRFSDPLKHDNPLPRGTRPYTWVSAVDGEFYLQRRYESYYHRPDEIILPPHVDFISSPPIPPTNLTNSKASGSGISITGKKLVTGFEVGTVVSLFFVVPIFLHIYNRKKRKN